VLASNEAWNVVLFGRRSTRGAFFAMLGFTLPLGMLQLSVKDDPGSTFALSPYSAWVIGYDLPWTYQLWRRNP
jgi:tryptophan-rich sensory protein